MQRKHNSKLTSNARILRKNMTKEEKHLWYDFLKDYPVRFLKQKVIDNYIVDFYCKKARLIIELDGSQHYTEEGMVKDKIRTGRIESRNLYIMRIPNNVLKSNFKEVCAYIDEFIKVRGIPPPPAVVPLPLGKGGYLYSEKTDEEGR